VTDINAIVQQVEHSGYYIPSFLMVRNHQKEGFGFEIIPRCHCALRNAAHSIFLLDNAYILKLYFIACDVDTVVEPFHAGLDDLPALFTQSLGCPRTPITSDSTKYITIYLFGSNRILVIPYLSHQTLRSPLDGHTSP